MVQLDHNTLDEVMNALDGKYLQPCPFCGGHAELSHTWTVAWAVACQICGCTIDDPDASGDESNDLTVHRESAKRAADRWNTRFTPEF